MRYPSRRLTPIRYLTPEQQAEAVARETAAKVAAWRDGFRDGVFGWPANGAGLTFYGEYRAGYAAGEADREALATDTHAQEGG